MMHKIFFYLRLCCVKCHRITNHRKSPCFNKLGVLSLADMLVSFWLIQNPVENTARRNWTSLHGWRSTFQACCSMYFCPGSGCSCFLSGQLMTSNQYFWLSSSGVVHIHHSQTSFPFHLVESLFDSLLLIFFFSTPECRKWVSFDVRLQTRKRTYPWPRRPRTTTTRPPL